MVHLRVSERPEMNSHAHAQVFFFHEWLCSRHAHTGNSDWHKNTLLPRPLLAVTRCKALWEIPLLASISWQEASGDAKEITQMI